MRSSRREPRRSARGPELARHFAGQRAEVDVAALHRHRAGVELGEVEQVGGELGQADDLFAHRVHELGPLLGARVLVLEQFDEAAEAEDRRAQLVRGVGDELLAGAVELGEAPLHLVEGAGELTELAGRGDRDRRFEVAVGDFAGGVLEPADVGRRRGGRSRCRSPAAITTASSAAEQDLPFDAAETAGGAADRDRVDVDEERGARPRSPTAISGDPVAQVGGPEPLQCYSLKR